MWSELSCVWVSLYVVILTLGIYLVILWTLKLVCVYMDNAAIRLLFNV